jgi:predicted Zn-dependent protease
MDTTAHDLEGELVAPPLVFPGQDEAQSAYQVAHDLLTRNAAAQALAVIDGALVEDPENAGLRSLRAWAYLMRAQLGPAERELRSLVADDPSDTWARHSLGRALQRQSRHAEALPHLRLAAAMSGDPAHAADVARVEARLAESGD